MILTRHAVKQKSRNSSHAVLMLARPDTAIWGHLYNKLHEVSFVADYEECVRINVLVVICLQLSYGRSE